MCCIIEREKVEHSDTKHIAIRMHILLQNHQDKVFIIQWIAGANNIADMMTKSALAVHTFVKHCDNVLEVQGSINIPM